MMANEREGRPIYHIERTIQESGRPFRDRSHIIYVTASMQDDTELGRLMHDFHCKNADDMYSGILAERVRALKETPKGVDSMCRELEQLYLDGKNEGIEKGRIEGRMEGRMEGRAEGIVSGIKSLMTTLDLSIEAAMSALEIPESERKLYVDLLAKQ